MNRFPEIVTRLYNNLVQPHLEYCCSVWNPYLVKDIELIGVQHRATEMVRCIEHLTYDELGIIKAESKKET